MPIAYYSMHVVSLKKGSGMGIKTMAKKEYRKFREYEEDYFRKNPDEIDDYLKEVFDEYAEDGNTPALLSSLRVISRVKGISEISRETGITRNGIQKALSEEGNPRLESINAIMHAMGYRLKPEKLQLPGA